MIAPNSNASERAINAFFETFPGRHSPLAPNPVVTFAVPSQSGFIGTTQTVNLSFDNTGSPGQTGYAPYIDVILPINGADGAGVGNNPVNDGVSLISATYLGRALTQTQVPFNASGQAQHPFAKDAAGNPVIVTGNAGDVLLVLTLPFGSFTTEQTPADVVLTLGVSNLADVGTLLPIKATGGFAYGADEFNNPTADAPIRGATATTQIEPTVATLDKIYLGPEQETATGPSYPRTWLVQGDFASGQPFTNVKLTDIIPDGVVVLGARLEDENGNTLPGTVSVNGPYGSQTVVGNFAGTIIGGAVKPTLVIDYYVTEFLSTGQPVLAQASGAFRPLENNAKLDADWQPIDARDRPTAHILIDPAGPEDIVTAKSVAVQKSVALVSPTDPNQFDPDADGNGVADWQPGGTLKYTLDGQVSNYFEMKDLVFKDTLGDGQTFKAGFVPQVVISEAGSVIYSGPVVYSISAKNAAGQTFLQFDVAQTLRNAGIIDDVLDGNGGGLTGNPHGTAYNQATAVVTFETTLDKNWTGPVPGDTYVDQGDPVINDVLFGGRVNSTGQYIEDDSHASVTLPVSSVEKSIYAINGDTSLGATINDPAQKIQAGDLITFRLNLDLPLTSAHSVTLTDYLPLPVLKALDLDANGSPDAAMTRAANGAIPAVNQWSFGPADTFLANAGNIPSITRSGPGNALTFNFGDVLNANYPRTTLDLLFTVRVNDQAFGDGLLLTNQVTSSEKNSFNEVSQDNEIVQFVLGEPRIKITKGVVAEDNAASGYFDAATGPAGVNWGAPGSGTSFTGTINSTNLAANPVNANAYQLDANDTVKFAVVLENIGSGPRGAFDLVIKDSIPQGFTLGAVPLNLKVTDGTGAALAYTGNPADIFTTGIQLTDPALHQGAVRAYDPTSGQNIVVVTYDLKIDSNVQAYDRLTNTATTASYGAEEGGINRTPTDSLADTDQAFVEITPKIGKVVVATSNPDTGSGEGDGGRVDVGIGETVTWRVTVVVPEGFTRNLVLKDILPGGSGAASPDEFELVSATVATVGANIVGPGVAAGATGVITDSDGDGINDTVTYSFGNVTNAPDNSETAGDRISFDITARVLDVPGNTRTDVETNKAIVSATAPDGSTRTTEVTSSVDVVEPVLRITKDANPTTVDADDTITYTVTLTNTAGSFRAPAYDISIDDLLDQLAPNAVFLPGTVSITSAPAGAGAAIVTGNGANDSSVKVTASRLLEGEAITLTFRAKATAVAISGQTIHNDVTADATSQPGTPPSDRPYDVTDPADVTIASPTITKSVFATSFADTGASQHNGGNQDVKVDEVVTYRMVVTVPEGQSINFRIIDQLADQVTAGGSSGVLKYIPGSAKVISAGANLSATSGILTPTISNTDSDNDGNAETVTYSFGTVTNTADNVSDAKDQIVVEIQARAENLATNQNADVLRNSAQAVTNFSQSNTATVDVDFVQPELDIQKSTTFTTGDAADVATYTVTIRHTGNSTNAAYNIAMGDILAPGISLVPGSAATNRGSISETGGNISLNLASLALNESVTITYRAKLADTVVNGQTIRNTATLDYQTDPTPGRVLHDSDYEDIRVAIQDSIVKDLVSTDNSYTPGSDVVAGETITYKLTVTLGEGAQRLIVDDVLPTGLTYVSSKVLSLGNIAGTSALPVGAAGSNSGQTLTFNFGDVINAGDNAVTAGDKVEIEVKAIVAPGTAGGLALTNTATVRPTTPANPYGVAPGTPMTPSSDTETVNTLALPNLGDKAFEDLNADGIQQVGEPGIQGVTVQLYNRDTGALVGTQVTDGNGLYLFTNLPPGKYYEVWSLPSGYVRTDADQGGNDAKDSDASATTGQTADFTLLGNQDDLTRDAGYWKPVTIGDNVTEDMNGNNIRDAGDVPLAGVTVKLLNGAGAVVGTTMTDGAGNYLFIGLKPGTYSVQFDKPAGYVFSDQFAAGNTALDSNADTTTGGTVPTTYISGADDRSIDALVYRPVTLGDRVFIDQNSNGVQDAADTNLAGVTVNLLNGANAVIGSTTTDANGNYLFTGLRPGSYHVQVVKPDGTWYFTAPDVGPNDAVDSDTNTGTGITPVKLYVSGDDDRTIDSGLYQLARIGDYTWVDRNGNGVQDGGEAPLAGVTVQLVNTATNTVVATAITAADGSYLFNVPPGTYREVFTPPAGYVPTITGQGTPATDSNPDATGTTPSFTVPSGGQDLTIDGGFYIPVKIGDRVFEDQNANGIQDAEDTNLAGVTVKLLDGAGTVVATQTTDANGNYLFTGLRPQDYQVEFVKPAGFITTAPDTGSNDAIDSDASTGNGRAPLKTYYSGDDDRTIDAGYYRPVTIGDKAFVDINKDGLQQSLEPGLAGVIVTLIDDRTGLTVGTQTTAADGSYLFTGYKPSEYHVEFSTPAGYSITTALVGGNRATDSNPNGAGVAPGIRLLSGQTDLTIDAGYQGSGKVSGNVFLDLPPGICGYKLPDAVFQGVKVELITTSGLVAATTTTDAQGNYVFTNVAPGQYVERFTAPDGTVFTQPKVAGTLNLRDSDVNPNGLTDAFTVANGDDIQMINAGLDYAGVGFQGQQPTYLPDGGGSYNFQGGAYAIGGNGSYQMMGNGGAPVYFIGGSGNNNLQGSGASGAILMGGGGSNIMEGTGGRDIIIGGCGPNNFQGLGSNNFQGLGGGNGCWNYDLLIGGISNDVITSNSGNAIITGNKGDDALDGQGVFVGGPNNGTVSYAGSTVTGYTVGDHIKLSGPSTVNYQVGDGVQWIENFSPSRGDTIEIYGYGAPIATGLVNGQYVMVFGPNAAIVLNGYQPQNGPLLGVNYHPNQSAMPGAFGHLDALPPVILSAGQDSFTGTQGDDIAIATDAFTTFLGNAGDDIAFGGEGGNLFVDGAGNDSYIGGGGNDIFRLTQGSNQVIGCSGNDVVQFDVTRAQATITTKPDGTVVVVTPQGEQVLKGIEWLSFTDQNVQLAPTANGAVLFGTAGSDQFQVTNANDLIVERPGQGNDTAWVSASGWTLSPEVENARLTGSATTLSGNALDNVLVANPDQASTVTGGSGDDEIWGGAADGSVLNGGAGNDVIRSGTGVETMIGGAGNDQFVVNNAGDTVVENAGEGTDTAWVGVNGWTVAANVEIVRLFGAATSVVIGGSSAQVVGGSSGSTITAQIGDNVFWGQAGNDTFVAGAGNDIFYAAAGGTGSKMYGGEGHDHYVVKNLGDQAFENANGGYDTAWVSVNNWTVGENIEVAYLSGSATTLTGNASGTNLVANSTAGSTLNAGSGQTIFWGSNFADTFNAGTGGSTMYGYGGADDFHFGVAHWGLAEIADFSHAEGDQLDFRGSGITGTGQLSITNYADKVQIKHGADEIILYGVTAPLVAGDFIF